MSSIVSLPQLPHYVRFARALAVVTSVALPACGGAVDPTPSTSQGASVPSTPSRSAAVPSGSPPVVDEPAAAGASADADAASQDEPQPPATLLAASDTPDAGVDAPRPHTSGPLAPPELPSSAA